MKHYGCIIGDIQIFGAATQIAQDVVAADINGMNTRCTKAYLRVLTITWWE